MSLADLGEDALIRRITRGIRVGSSVLRGIGDDCAVLSGSGRMLQLFASDMLVEGVHFLRGTAAEAVGWKALAVNVSDVAAMGGLPRHAVISLGLPRRARVAWVDGLYRGLRRCAARFGVNLVGGDTVRAPCAVIAVAILGEAERGRVVFRGGARAGDWLLVTGKLGGSLKSGRHLRFMPRVQEARALAARGRLHAMMDLSDGLWADLPRLCRASGVSAVLEPQRIPRHSGCSLREALTDGEDFELLIAAPEPEARRLLRWAQGNLACGLHRIGEVVRRRPGGAVRLLLPEGTRPPGALRPFHHF